MNFIIFYYFLFYMFINKLNKNKNNAFEIYRSLSCLHLTCTAFIKTVSNLKEHNTKTLLHYTEYDIYSTKYYFYAYLMNDVLIMLFRNKIRNDLIFHHALAFICFSQLGMRGNIINLLLLAEIYSSLNFIKYLDTSKKLEKFVYLWKAVCICIFRMPIFSMCFYSVYINSDMISVYFYTAMKYFYITFISLDCYWLSKCLKKII